MAKAGGARIAQRILLIALLTACVTTAGTLIYRYLIVPDQLYRQIKVELQGLVHRRPADIPRGEWEYAVGWTLNLHANCGVPYSGQTSGMETFSGELSRRLDRPVDLSTIDWIWDEYARLTKRGKSYSDKYRPTKSPELQQAEVGCFNLWVE